MPDDGASIGSVYVDVLPRVDDAWGTRLAAQMTPQADRLGNTIGAVAAKAMADRIAKGVGDGLDKGSRDSTPKSTKGGEQAGGAFAEAFRRRVEAALKALPDAKVDADTSAADRKLAELRTELADLTGKRVGVDISDAEAIAQVRALQVELSRLARESPSIRITSDASRAAVELQGVHAEAERLARLNPNIHIDTNAAQVIAELEAVKRAAGDAGGGGGMGALLAAGLALGPGLIPVAGAAAGALAGIGLAAVAGAAGFGAVILATRGVSDAVKALATADGNANQTAQQYAAAQDRVAQAQDGVASAERSLANTRATAADGQRRAAEAVGNAQDSLAAAERGALTAEQDLTRARQEARRAMEDLTNQVADGALAQRAAQLDLQKTQQALQATLANPASTQLQRQEAQLAYDEAKQRITDLATRQRQLTDDQRQAQRVGVEGSQQVVAAQDRVTQSQDQVRKATQALADSRIAEGNTARQNAFAIEQATQGVATAQRSLAQAQQAAAQVGQAANQKLADSFTKLAPAGQQFAVFLYSLRSVWQEITGAAQGGFLPGLQAGMQAMLPVVPLFVANLRSISAEAGNLAASAGRAFASPYWVQFGDILTRALVPAMRTGAQIMYDLALAASGLVRGFLPLGQSFGEGVLTFVQRFAAWSVTLDRNPGFQHLLDYIRTQGPIVGHVLLDVGSAVLRVVEAIQPLGGFSLSILHLFADTINALPIPVLTTLAAVIIPVVLATQNWSRATQAWTTIQKAATALLPVWTALQTVYNSAVTGAGTAMAASTGRFGAFSTAVAGVGGAARGAGGAMSGLAASIGTGGIIGLALAGAFVAFTAVSSAIAAQKQRTTELRNAMVQLHDALNEVGGANKDTVKSIVEGNEDFSRAVRLAGDYGLTSNQLIAALKGEKGAQDEVRAALNAKIAADEKQFRSFSLSDAGLAQLNRERQLRDALNQTYGQINDNARVEQLLTAEQNKTAGSAFQQTEAQKALGNALNVVADASSTAAQKADALKQADDAVFGAARNADQAAEDYAAAQDRLNQSVTQGSHDIGVNTGAARDNYDAVKNLLKAADDEYFANIRGGMSVEDATKKHDKQTAALVEQAKRLGLDAGQVQHLIDTYGRVPTNVSTQIQVSGVQAALDQLKNLEIAQISLRQGVDVPTATRIWREQNPTAGRADVGGHATGGPIFGPGGPTDDSIPAWLSNGEHVWTAAEVRAAGGHTVVEMLRRAVLGGVLDPPRTRYPGDGSAGVAFAQGGAVTWPFPVSLAGLWKPTPQELAAAVFYGPAYTGPISGNIGGIQAFIRAQAGKPYIWDSAGPAGYDCSGAVSAVFNLAHGRGAYNHTFSTMNEAPFFPLGGFGGLMTAGWTNPGERGPGGSSVGHTAAVFAGLPFESRGGDGFVVGSRVTPIGEFAHVGHFDRGGVLPPGVTIARNDTGRNELVLTAEQAARIGSDGAAITVNVYPQPDHSPAEIAAMVKHELAWQMR